MSGEPWSAANAGQAPASRLRVWVRRGRPSAFSHKHASSMLRLLRRLFSSGGAAGTPPQPESQFVVRVTDSDVVCERPDGQTERVAWDDLQTIVLETTDDGPWAPDVFWILAGSAASGRVIPQGATGDKALLERLQQLPGFNSEEFIRAMGSTSNRKFLCWRR